MKHTKGPWRVGDAGNTVFGPKTANPSPETIANIKRKANARLIAAAPELLEHIKGFVKLIETAEELNNAATDSGNSPQKKGVTWLDYRALTQNIRDTAKLLVAKAEGLTDKETADEAALRG